MNVPGCVGLGTASLIAGAEMIGEAERQRELSKTLLRSLQTRLDAVKVHGHETQRLPGNLNVCFTGADADSLMLMIPDVALSSGSACSSARPQPSHVLLALGVSYVEAQQSIRFGIGRFTTVDDVRFATDRLADAVVRLRAMSSVAK